MTDILIVNDVEQVVEEVAVAAIVETTLDADTIVTVDDSTTIITEIEPTTVLIEPEVIVNVDVLTVGEQGPAGPPGTGTEIYEQRAEITSDYEVYRGEAELGAQDSDPVWRVRKIIIFYGVAIATTTTWANGLDGFVHVWDNRHSYIFS